MKNVLLTIVVAVVALFGVGYAIDAIQAKNAVDTIQSASEDKSSKPLMTESEARAEFMGGCDTGQLTNQTSYCECVYREMRKVSTINELANDGLTMSASQIEAKYAKQIDRCVTEIYGSSEL